MASSPTESGAGRVLRRSASRPRIPHRWRSLVTRPAPLVGVPRPAIAHGPLDVPGLAVRRPFWWVTAHRHLLRRRQPATPPAWPASRPDVTALSMAVPPPAPALAAGAPLGAAPSGVAAALARPSVVDPFAPRPAPLVAPRPLVGATAARPGPVVAAAPPMPMAVPGPGHLAAVLHARAAAAPPEPAPGGTPAGAIAAVPELAGPLAAYHLARPAVHTAQPPVAPPPGALLRSAPGPRAGQPAGSTGAPGRRLPEPRTFRADQVGELRVLGAAPATAPYGGFDPVGALAPTPPAGLAPPVPSSVVAAPAARRGATTPRMRPEPAPAQSPRGSAAAGRAMSGASAPAPAESPAARWRAAVTARPLESPRPFPASLHPLVENLAGSAQRATYTTGPATRHALAAAGAHGATTGSVVHLPTAPSVAPGPLLGVVAHELAHARNPVTRPRFLLGVPHGGIDADERNALGIGRRFAAAAGGGADAVRAGIVDDLPVGGLTRVAGFAGQARDAVSGYAGDAVGGAGPPDLGSGAPGLPSLPGAGMPGADLGAAASGAASAAMGAAGSAVDSVTGALSAAAGADGTPGGAPPPSTVDIDRLADLLEQRLLKQIERRGGRYAGVF